MRNLLLSCFFAVGLAAPLSAQIPPDWAAYSAFEWPLCSPGLNGGIWAFMPRRPFLRLQITGLPRELTGVGTKQAVGSNCILVRHCDGQRGGALVVGEVNMNPTPYPSVDIWLVTLNGFAVSKATRYVFRTGRGAIHEMDWLPDGRVVFTYHMSQPVVNVGLAILDLKTGGFTNIPVTGIPAAEIANALTVSPGGKTVYLGTAWKSGTKWNGKVYSVPITPPGAGKAVFGFNIGASVMQMDMDNDGTLLVGDSPGAISKLNVARTPFTLAWRKNSGLSSLNALEVDRLTGNYLLSGTVGTGTPAVYSITPGWTLTLITGNLPACPRMLPLVAGIAMRNSVEEYGKASPGRNRYNWANHPGPFPRIGTTFPLRVAVTPGPVRGPAVMVLGAAPLPLPGVNTGLGFFLTTFPVVPLIPIVKNTVSVQIPNNTVFQGLSFFAQGVYGEPPLWRSTRGLCVTIL